MHVTARKQKPVALSLSSVHIKIPNEHIGTTLTATRSVVLLSVLRSQEFTDLTSFVITSLAGLVNVSPRGCLCLATLLCTVEKDP
jgi:hypothetical protein